jgi:hypothetical protein
MWLRVKKYFMSSRDRWKTTSINRSAHEKLLPQVLLAHLEQEILVV